MIGPSSSHTAGACRIGLLARALLDATPEKAAITLHGSFAKTGRGHGTDRALVAGILGMRPDDGRIPQALAEAEKRGWRSAGRRQTSATSIPTRFGLPWTAAADRPRWWARASAAAQWRSRDRWGAHPFRGRPPHVLVGHEDFYGAIAHGDPGGGGRSSEHRRAIEQPRIAVGARR
jgi:L-serine dehydratase